MTLVLQIRNSHVLTETKQHFFQQFWLLLMQVDIFGQSSGQVREANDLKAISDKIRHSIIYAYYWVPNCVFFISIMWWIKSDYLHFTPPEIHVIFSIWKATVTMLLHTKSFNLAFFNFKYPPYWHFSIHLVCRSPQA